jgi:hypothetical protein
MVDIISVAHHIQPKDNKNQENSERKRAKRTSFARNASPSHSTWAGVFLRNSHPFVVRTLETSQTHDQDNCQAAPSISIHRSAASQCLYWELARKSFLLGNDFWFPTQIVQPNSQIDFLCLVALASNWGAKICIIFVVEEIPILVGERHRERAFRMPIYWLKLEGFRKEQAALDWAL